MVLSFIHSYTFFFFLTVSSSGLLASLLGHVAVVVEVAEESDEAERVGQHNRVHGVGEVAVGKQVVGGVDGHSEELELGGGRDNKLVRTRQE